MWIGYKKLWIIEHIIHSSSNTFSTAQKPISKWTPSIQLFSAGHFWPLLRLEQRKWWWSVAGKSHWGHFWPTNQWMTFVTKNYCWQDESPWNKKFAIRNFETSSQLFFKRKSNDSQPALEISIASKLQKTRIDWTVSKIIITDFSIVEVK